MHNLSDDGLGKCMDNKWLNQVVLKIQTLWLNIEPSKK